MKLRLLGESEQSSAQTERVNRDLATAAEPSRAPPQARQQRQTRAQGQTSSVASSWDVHRTLPHSLEAEMGVLGSMLQSPRDTIPDVVARIDASYFHVPAHQTIFAAIVKMWDNSQAIDIITLGNHLDGVGQTEAVGGRSFITSLFTFVPTAANVTFYLEIMRDKFLCRQMIAAGTETVRRAYEEQDEVNVLVDEVEQKFIGLGDDRFRNQSPTIKESVMVAIEEIENCYERRGKVVGVPTGFSELDKMTGGLRGGEMIVIAARPSMGKTSLAMNIAEYAAVDARLPVAVFSLEMSNSQLVQRLLASRARVNLQRIREGFLSERDFPALTVAAAKFADSKLYIDDTAALPILELRAKARRMRAMFHVELIVVDYLQLLRSGTKRGQENRQVEVSDISAGLKNLAKELNIPVLVLAQLNRQPEARQGGKPRLSDLRESGSIEQDADVVGLLVRREVYEEDEDARMEMAGEAELIIAKQRNGPVGEVNLTFLKEFTRFEDRARH